MTDAQASSRHGRRGARGLIIEGTAVRLNGAAAGVGADGAGPASFASLDLGERAARRPYQSLLDDAMRLARRCGPFGPAGWRVASPSS